MRYLLRELARAMVVLALVGLGLGQIGAAVAGARSPAPLQHHGAAEFPTAGHHHHHPAMDDAQDPDRHGAATGTSALPCFAACCCAALSGFAQPSPNGALVRFASGSVLYPATAQRASGRSDAPDPGVPKHLA
jgi:hypothetical protein